MGAFDDLVPIAQSSGAFDDLVPSKPKEPSTIDKIGKYASMAVPGLPLVQSLADPNNHDIRDLVGGGMQGAGDIGATLIRPFETGEESRQRREKITQGLAELGFDPESTAHDVGRFGAQMLGTGGVGSGLAKGATIAGAPKLARALETFGATTGVKPVGLGQKAAELATRAGAGAVTGGAGTALVSPEDAGMGVGIGTVAALTLPMVGKIVGSLTERVSDKLSRVFGNNPEAVSIVAQQKAKKVIEELANGDMSALERAIAKYPTLPVDEALAREMGEVSPTGIQALGQIFRDELPDYYNRLNATRKAVDVNRIGEFAGGASDEAAAIGQRQFMDHAEEVLGARRTVMLNDLVTSGKLTSEIEAKLSDLERQYINMLRTRGVLQTQAAQQGMNAQGRIASENQLIRNYPEGAYPQQPSLTTPTAQVRPQGAFPVPGMPRVPPRYTPNEAVAQQYQAAADELGLQLPQLRAESDYLKQLLEKQGTPFTVSPVVQKLESMLPAAKANPDAERVLQAMIQRVKSIGDDPILIAKLRSVNVNGLLNREINKGTIASADEVRALKEVKNAIDEQFGAEYTEKYLKPYSRAFEQRNMMQLYNELRGYLESGKPDEFLKFMKGNNRELLDNFGINADTVKEALGAGAYDDMMKIAKTLESTKHMEKTAGLGRDLAAKVLDNNTSIPSRLPHWFSPVITSANTTIAMLEKSLKKGTVDALTVGMRSGADMQKLLASLPASERSIAAKWIKLGGLNRAVPATTSAVGNNE